MINDVLKPTSDLLSAGKEMDCWTAGNRRFALGVFTFSVYPFRRFSHLVIVKSINEKMLVICYWPLVDSCHIIIITNTCMAYSTMWNLIGLRSESSNPSPNEQFIHQMDSSFTFTRWTDQGMDSSFVYQINFQIIDWTVNSQNKLLNVGSLNERWFTEWMLVHQMNIGSPNERGFTE